MCKDEFGYELWEMPFMVDQGIVLGHIILVKGLKVDKAKIDVIRNLP